MHQIKTFESQLNIYLYLLISRYIYQLCKSIYQVCTSCTCTSTTTKYLEGLLYPGHRLLQPEERVLEVLALGHRHEAQLVLDT